MLSIPPPHQPSHMNAAKAGPASPSEASRRAFQIAMTRLGDSAQKALLSSFALLDTGQQQSLFVWIGSLGPGEQDSLLTKLALLEDIQRTAMLTSLADASGPARDAHLSLYVNPQSNPPDPPVVKTEASSSINTNDVGPGSATGGSTVSAGNIGGRDVNVFNGDVVFNPPVEPPPQQEPEKKVEPEAEENKAAEEAYLRHLFRWTRRVSLGGINLDEANATREPTEVTLDAVYVALNTRPSEKVRRGERPAARIDSRDEAPVLLPALEAVRHNRRLVLLGDPGSGKSTFANYVAMCLAGARLEPEAGWLKRLESAGFVKGKGEADDPKDTLLPVQVVLRDFAASLSENAKSASAEELREHIQSDLKKNGLEDYGKQLFEALRDGKCMVLLDGLDEVPDPARRGLVRDAVKKFAECYWRNRFVVTCRVLSYTDPAWQLSEFPSTLLVPFDDDQISDFIGAWYTTLARQERLPKDVAEAKAAELRDAAIYLRDLAENPMLLTVMAVIHTFEGTLPYERARLYHEAVKLLLWRWQAMKRVAGDNWDPGIEKRLGIRAERLFNALCELAWKAHSKQGQRDGAADLPMQDVLFVLRGYLNDDWNKARTFFEYVEERAGLLVGRGIRGDGNRKDEKDESVYAFPHRTFQEFLAACYLTGQREFSRLVLEDLIPKGDMWREVVLLAAGHLVFNQNVIAAPLDMVNVLCPEKKPTDRNGWRAVWWAGEILAIVGAGAARRDTVGKRVLPRVRKHLVALIEGGHLSPAQRVQAADALGRLGDPRKGVRSSEPALVRIEGGSFEMGEGVEKHHVTLQAFQMARFPVTNAQFWQFIDGGGYEKRRYWTEAGWAWRQAAGDDLAGFASDLRWGIANRPVVGVNWHEAMAFAAWLAHQTRKAYRLPTEAEWERAAAGTEGRTYPWGDEWHDGVANTQEAGIGHTSAVGAFPTDCTPEGICDMGGNTWEWTLSRPEDYPYNSTDSRNDLAGTGDRVLRGGAASNSKRLARCTYRNWVAPDSRVPFIGFRVVVSELSRALPAPSEEATP